MRKEFILFVIVLVTISVSACDKLETQFDKNSTNVPYENEDFAMGTIISQRIYDNNAEEISKKVMDKIREIEDKMTINKSGGEIDKLNASAGIDFVELNEDAIYVLEKAKEFSKISNGAFDVMVGPLVKEWGVFSDNPSIPSAKKIEDLLSLVNYEDVIIDKSISKAKLRKKSQVVDLGGIAKGFAGDKAIELYREHKVNSAFINIGGNIVLLGSKPDGSLWKVGVRNPTGPEGTYIGVISAKDKAIVSSGDYQRYFEKDGVRYHHIIDPRTGYPADSGLIGTTVISDLSIDADALSTATFVLGLEKGMDLIEELEGVEAVFITKDKKIYITKGLSSSFKFEDDNNEYEYVEKR
ncbi:MAG: FAD:protein FMN transferase [Clostridiaceae bacterium]|jgi:thiamine biosynthesis lipoprotein|nr:FAD:protein FMN transferase [Clostridiaceae bacterium]